MVSQPAFRPRRLATAVEILESRIAPAATFVVGSNTLTITLDPAGGKAGMELDQQGTNLQLDLDGNGTYETAVLKSNFANIVVNGGANADEFVISFARGNPAIGENLSYNGGGGADKLTFAGFSGSGVTFNEQTSSLGYLTNTVPLNSVENIDVSGATSFGYTGTTPTANALQTTSTGAVWVPSPSASNTGTLTTSLATTVLATNATTSAPLHSIKFTGPLTVTTAGSLDLQSLNVADNFILNGNTLSGTAGAATHTGSFAGVNTLSVTLGLSTESTAIPDQLTVQAFPTDASLQNLLIFLGTGDDTLTFDPAVSSFNLPVPGGIFHLYPSSGIDTINYTGDVNQQIAPGGPGMTDFTLTSAAGASLGKLSFVGTSPEKANLTGGPGDNVFRFSGYGGAATVNGLGGADTVIGVTGLAATFNEQTNTLAYGTTTVVLTATENIDVTGALSFGYTGTTPTSSATQTTSTGVVWVPSPTASNTGTLTTSLATTVLATSATTSAPLHTIKYGGPLTITTAGALDLQSLGVADNYTLNGNTLSGTTAGFAHTGTFAGVNTLSITLGLSTESAPIPDALTVAALPTDAALQSLLFFLGTGDDTLTIQAGVTNFNLPTPGGILHFYPSSGTDTLNYTGDANVQLSTSGLTLTALDGTPAGTLSFIGTPERANLTGGTGDNTFRLSGYTGTGTINGLGGTDTVIGVTNQPATFSEATNALAFGGTSYTVLGTETIDVTGALSFAYTGIATTPTATTSVVWKPSATAANTGTLTTSSTATASGNSTALHTIQFSGPLTVSTAEFFDLQSLGVADNYTLVGNTLAGTTGGFSQSGTFTGVNTVSITLGLSTESTPIADQLTILALPTDAALQSLLFFLGTGDDSITFGPGVTNFGLPLPGGILHLYPSSGTDTLNYSGDVNQILSGAGLSILAGAAAAPSTLTFIGTPEIVNLTGGPSANAFNLAGFNGSGSINGAGGSDSLTITQGQAITFDEAAHTLSYGTASLALSSVESLNLTAPNVNYAGNGTQTITWLPSTATDQQGTISGASVQLAYTGALGLSKLAALTLTTPAGADDLTLSSLSLGGTVGGRIHTVALSEIGALAIDLGTGDGATATADRFIINGLGIAKLGSLVISTGAGDDTLVLGNGLSSLKLPANTANGGITLFAGTGNDSLEATDNVSMKLDSLVEGTANIDTLEYFVNPVLTGTSTLPEEHALTTLNSAGVLRIGDSSVEKVTLTGGDIGGDTSPNQSLQANHFLIREWSNPSVQLTLNGGAGDDTFFFYKWTKANAVVNGGDGNDELNLSPEGLGNPQANARIVGWTVPGTFNGDGGTQNSIRVAEDVNFQLTDSALTRIAPKARYTVGNQTLTADHTEAVTVLTNVQHAHLTGGQHVNTIDAHQFSGIATLVGGRSRDNLLASKGGGDLYGYLETDAPLTAAQKALASADHYFISDGTIAATVNIHATSVLRNVVSFRFYQALTGQAGVQYTIGGIL